MLAQGAQSLIKMEIGCLRKVWPAVREAVHSCYRGVNTSRKSSPDTVAGSFRLIKDRAERPGHLLGKSELDFWFHPAFELTQLPDGRVWWD